MTITVVAALLLLAATKDSASAASGGKDLAFYANGSASKGFDGTATQVVLCARGTACNGPPRLKVYVGGALKGGRPHQCHLRGPQTFFASNAEIARLHSQPKTGANYLSNILHKEVLGLHHVYAVTDQENAPSVAVLERVRPRREGAFVENAWFEGRWSSGYLCAATLRKEWLAWA
jgi:hypothetical protein